ncbi:MAG: hypothetical protein D6812_09610, partial [Deltaproteobacteria bacterium]
MEAFHTRYGNDLETIMRLHWAAIAFGVALFVLPTTGRAESGKSVARAIYDTYEDRADGWKASLTRNVKS